MQKAINKQGKRKQTFHPLYAFIGIAIVAVVISSRSCIQSEKQIQPATANQEFKKEGHLIFVDKKGGHTLATIDIEIAEDERARALGLMHRYSMREDQGMLFIMDLEKEQSFWMKDTYISLDILFVNSQMEIVKIQKHTQPFSQQSIPSVEPAKYVVEVVAGFCNRHNINKGDRIKYKQITPNH